LHRSSLLLVATIAVALIASTSATATNATLRTTVNAWSKKIGADARSIALAAQQRHPRRMTSGATRFHTDALHARAAVVTQKPSTANGQRARRLALAAFSDYALAGSKWAASGRARLAHHRSASIAYANAGAAYAHTADKLLLTAGKLLG
jgi:hypothetical protein